MASVAIPFEEQSIVKLQAQELGIRRYVLSLHFMTKEVRRNGFVTWLSTAATTYTLPGIPTLKSRPSVCIVMDALGRQYVKTDSNKRKIYEPYTIPSRDIALDVVREASGANNGGPELDAPAIWISSGGQRVDHSQGREGVNKNVILPPLTVGKNGETLYGSVTEDGRLNTSEWDKWGTPEFASKYPGFMSEIEAFREREIKRCNGWIGQADDFYSTRGRDSRWMNITKEIHIAAGNFMEIDSAEHPWMDAKAREKSTHCEFCGAITSSTAPKCVNCGEIINPEMFAQRKKQMAERMKAAGLEEGGAPIPPTKPVPQVQGAQK